MCSNCVRTSADFGDVGRSCPDRQRRAAWRATAGTSGRSHVRPGSAGRGAARCGFSRRYRVRRVRAFSLDMDSRASALVAGVGEDRELFQVGPGPRGRTSSRAAVTSWVLPGSTSQTHSGMPQGAASAWTMPACWCAFPEYQASISLPFRLVFCRAPVGGDQRAVQDQVRKSLLNGPVQGFASAGAFAASTLMASSLYR